jgi:hypothetical protein
VRCWTALHELVRDEPERPRPGPIGRWITEKFNDWPEGSRAAAEAADGTTDAEAPAHAAVPSEPPTDRS